MSTQKMQPAKFFFRVAFHLWPCYKKSMDMHPQQLREILGQIGVSQTELKAWLGDVDDRTIRRYLAPPGSPGARGIHPGMALLFRLLARRLELVEPVREIVKEEAANASPVE
jgi:hypothetical protein